jgi:hypothetical protein
MRAITYFIAQKSPTAMETDRKNTRRALIAAEFVFQGQSFDVNMHSWGTYKIININLL